MVTDVLVAFDHLRHEVTVLANVLIEGGSLRAGRARPLAHDELTLDRRRGDRGGQGAPGGAGAADRARQARAAGVHVEHGLGRASPTAVERAKEYIRAGDAYQVVPSQRWTADCPVDAFSIYRGLRAINPSPYMYFLDFEDFEIAGASPESLVKVDRPARRAASRSPARGRARGSDRELTEELLADEKERAEHVMLVDLGRNDLGPRVRVRQRQGRRADGRRDLLARACTSSRRCRARCARR